MTATLIGIVIGIGIWLAVYMVIFTLVTISSRREINLMKMLYKNRSLLFRVRSGDTKFGQHYFWIPGYNGEILIFDDRAYYGGGGRGMTFRFLENNTKQELYMSKSRIFFNPVLKYYCIKMTEFIHNKYQLHEP